MKRPGRCIGSTIEFDQVYSNMTFAKYAKQHRHNMTMRWSQVKTLRSSFVLAIQDVLLRFAEIFAGHFHASLAQGEQSRFGANCLDMSEHKRVWQKRAVGAAGHKWTAMALAWATIDFGTENTSYVFKFQLQGRTVEHGVRVSNYLAC